MLAIHRYGEATGRSASMTPPMCTNRLVPPITTRSVSNPTRWCSFAISAAGPAISHCFALQAARQRRRHDGRHHGCRSDRRKRVAMKAIKLLSFGIGLAALLGCAAEAPSVTPADYVSVGTPTPLVSAPSVSSGAAPHPLMAPYRSSPPPAPDPTTPVAIDNSYHPHWIVDVYGFQ